MRGHGLGGHRAGGGAGCGHARSIADRADAASGYALSGYAPSGSGVRLRRVRRSGAPRPYPFPSSASSATPVIRCSGYVRTSSAVWSYAVTKPPSTRTGAITRWLAAPSALT